MAGSAARFCGRSCGDATRDANALAAAGGFVMLVGPSGNALPLAIGTVLAVGALAFVLAPLAGKSVRDDALDAPFLEVPATALDGDSVNDTIDDAVDAAIRRARATLRACVTCGPRPEPDATYCSNCGKYLPDECARCHAPVVGTGAAFCGECGGALNDFVQRAP
jgi:hypothetical protein